MQTPDFAPVRDLLEQQLSQYRKLLSLMEEMRECMIMADAEALDKLVRAQAAQLRQLATLEKKRLAAEEVLCGALSLASPTTLRELISKSEGNDKAVLAQIQADFALLIPQLQTAQAVNKELLQTNIELNDTMLGLLTGPEDPLNNFYSADGRETEEKIISPGIFDQQI